MLVQAVGEGWALMLRCTHAWYSPDNAGRKLRNSFMFSSSCSNKSAIRCLVFMWLLAQLPGYTCRVRFCISVHLMRRYLQTESHCGMCRSMRLFHRAGLNTWFKAVSKVLWYWVNVLVLLVKTFCNCVFSPLLVFFRTSLIPCRTVSSVGYQPRCCVLSLLHLSLGWSPFFSRNIAATFAVKVLPKCLQCR